MLSFRFSCYHIKSFSIHSSIFITTLSSYLTRDLLFLSSHTRCLFPGTPRDRSQSPYQRCHRTRIFSLCLSKSVQNIHGQSQGQSVDQRLHLYGTTQALTRHKLPPQPNLHETDRRSYARIWLRLITQPVCLPQITTLLMNQRSLPGRKMTRTLLLLLEHK